MKTVFNLYAQARLLRQKVTLRGQSNELFVICAACSNREGKARISGNVAGVSSGFCLTLLIDRGMPIMNTTETRYGKYVNQQIPGESR